MKLTSNTNVAGNRIVGNANLVSRVGAALLELLLFDSVCTDYRALAVRFSGDAVRCKQLRANFPFRAHPISLLGIFFAKQKGPTVNVQAKYSSNNEIMRKVCRGLGERDA